MSTRAVITFADDGQQFHVYKHGDGQPAEIGKALEATLPYAWPLPRYEATDFAAAFIAANKQKHGGGIALTTHWTDHGDLGYRYLLYVSERTVMVRAVRTSMSTLDVLSEQLLFDGPLLQFLKWTKQVAEHPNGVAGAPVTSSARIRRTR
jgi:hypothetical protein